MAGDGNMQPPDQRRAEVATEIRRCVGTSPPDRHAARRWVAQFMDECARAAPARQAAMVAVEPELD